jgi:hypothetical protein
MALAGESGEFAILMQDLRRLAGCEALLAVTSDLPTLAFLLRLSEQSAMSVAASSRRVLERVQHTPGGG